MKLYLIRHAESEANAAADLDNPTYYYDARITKRGKEQALKLSQKIKDLSFDKFFCSPLTRTMETFSLVFPNKKPILEPLIREHLYHSCDVGRQPQILKKEFQDYNFSNLSDYWWNNNIPINEVIGETVKAYKAKNYQWVNALKPNLQYFIQEYGIKTNYPEIPYVSASSQVQQYFRFDYWVFTQYIGIISSIKRF